MAPDGLLLLRYSLSQVDWQLERTVEEIKTKQSMKRKDSERLDEIFFRKKFIFCEIEISNVIFSFAQMEMFSVKIRKRTLSTQL